MIANATLKSIKVAAVASVYSGKPGCMCGCLGKHTYASAHRDAASKRRGYKVDDDEVSDRTVKLIVGKINAAIAAGKPVEVKDGYVFWDNSHTETYHGRWGMGRQVRKGRVYCAYFAKQS